jgi:hypothetical protein
VAAAISSDQLYRLYQRRRIHLRQQKPADSKTRWASDRSTFKATFYAYNDVERTNGETHETIMIGCVTAAKQRERTMAA